MVRVLLLAPLAACATTSASSPAPPATRSFAVAPGKFAEANVAIDAGGVAVAEFTASAALDWNVHSHEGDQVIVHAEDRSSSGTIRFAAPRAGRYSFLWRLPPDAAGPAELRATVSGARVESWHP